MATYRQLGDSSNPRRFDHTTLCKRGEGTTKTDQPVTSVYIRNKMENKLICR